MKGLRVEHGPLGIMLTVAVAGAARVGAAGMQGGGTPPAFSQLTAAHGHSVPGPIAVSPSGDTCFVAEAGVLKVTERDDPDGWEDDGGVVPISSHHVRAIELALDPEADLDQGLDGPEDLLYVAGGRLGLWVMRADPSSVDAARVDDAEDQQDVPLQSSRRWCNDVDFLTLEGTTYLLALFAAKDDSRLRLYELERVRAVLNSFPGEETGNEIWPDQEIVLSSNPAISSPSFSSFAYGMAVDGHDVYVALGQQGLVRVTFCHNFCTPSTVGGPWFGDGSHYADTITSGPYAGLYEDFVWFATVTGTGTPTGPELHRHPPYFADVAVEHAGTQTYLWSAVDHVGLVRFDVTQPNGWSGSTPIDHQEGEVLTITGQKLIRLVDPDHDTGIPASSVKTYAHRLSILEGEEEEGVFQKRVLAVAVAGSNLFRSDVAMDEGRLIDYLCTPSQGVRAPYPLVGPPVGGARQYTLLYDLKDLTPVPPATPPTGAEEYNYAELMVGSGGSRVLLAPEPASDEVVVLGANRVPDTNNANFLAVYSWPLPALGSGPSEFLQRHTAHRPGRHASSISFLRVNPTVFVSGSNDSGVQTDGILVICLNGIIRFYRPDPTDANDGRATFGVTPDEHAIWPASATEDWVAGSQRTEGAVPTHPGRKRWMVALMYGGENLCPGAGMLDEPDRVKHMFMETPLDRFLDTGRGNYIGMTFSEEYNAFLESLELDVEAIIIGTRDESPDGWAVLDWGVLEGAFTSVNDGDVLDETITTGVVYHLDDLDTHPEYARVPVATSTADDSYRFMHEQHLSSALSHFPVFMQVSSHEEEGPEKHWILAGGVGTIYFPEGLRDFLVAEGNTTWLPQQIYQTYDSHSMIRVFDVQDPTSLTDTTVPTDLPTYTLIGPDPETHAFRVHPIEIDGRNYLAVSDLGGAVQIWDLTDLLDASTPSIIHPNMTTRPYGDFFLERWLTPDCVTDEHPNAVWSMAGETITVGDPEDLEDPERDVERLYVMVGRVGIEVLEFDPSVTSGPRLTRVGGIETPNGSGGLRIRHGPSTGDTDLLVIERDAGVRIFER